MKAMMISDLVSSRTTISQLLRISVFVSLFVGYMSGQLVTVVGCIGAMVPFMYLFTVASYDELNGWERFRLTMPISRRDVAFGRYGSFLAVVVISAAVAVIVALIAGAIAQLLPADVVEDTVRLDAWSVTELLAAGLLVGVVILAAAALSLPVIMRFGLNRGSRFVPVVVVLALSAAVGLFGSNADMLNLDSMLSDTGTIVLVLVVLTVVTLVLYCASAVLSARLYAKREF